MASVYEPRDGGVFATEYARGPWDPNAQHGGAPAALLMRAFERAEGDPALRLARVTYELLRPVPLGDLRLGVEVERPGRRVQLLSASLFAPDGTEVVRARALKVARAGLEAGELAGGPVDWQQAPQAEFPFPGEQLTRFPGDAVELRFAEGRFERTGPARVWFRLRVPVLAGEQPSGYQRMAAAADFPNGVATPLSWDRYVFINPDLTIHIDREPLGEWICMQATMRVSSDGVGQSEGLLYDERGRVGRSLQSLYIAKR